MGWKNEQITLSLVIMRVLCVFVAVLLVVAYSKPNYPDPEKLLGKGVQISGEELHKIREQFQILNNYQRALNEKNGVSTKGNGTFGVDQHGNKLNVTDIPNLNRDALHYLYQGDILLTAEQAEALVDIHVNRGVQTVPQSYWDTSKPIPYYYDPSLSSEARASIAQAIQFWQDNSCISFTMSNSLPQRLRFFKGVGCYSSIGKQWRQDSQDVSIGNGCEGFGTVAHEIAHALGFFHEQSRSDRDQYVRVDFSNIIDDLEYNFVKNSPSSDLSYGLGYDYGSVMQYNAYAFALDTNKKTVTAIDQRYQNNLGQREAPAFSNIKILNMAYNCGAKCGNSATRCYNQGFPHPRNCARCLCPKYFTGNDCSQLARGNAPVCNGGYNVATSNWQSLSGQVGSNNFAATKVPVDCYWQITAPAGRQVQLRLRTPPSQCAEGCNWQGLDINLGSFDKYGMLTCCDTRSEIWTTTGNMAVIRGISRYNIASFVMEYKYV